MGFQPLPNVNADTEGFWTSGADGVLRIARCGDCRSWYHPPSPVCPECLSLRVGMEPTSGRATVKSFSINVQPWAPDMQVPFVVGVVSIDDAPGVQLTTRFVEVDPERVIPGMKVEVVFQEADDVYLPLFRPVEGDRP